MKIRLSSFLRFIVFTFTLEYVLLSANAQKVSLNSLRDGDKYTQYQIVFDDTVSKGSGKVWDISEAEIGDASLVEISLLNDSLMIFQIMHHSDRSVTYLNQRHNEIKLIEFENNLWKVNFGEGLSYLRNKSHAEDAETVYGKGTYCERFHYLLLGRHTLCCDASGTLILPEGDTIRNINRLHSVQAFTHRFLNGNMPNLGALQLDIRRWYASGYRYPIVESQTLSRLSTGAVLLQNAFYTPLSEMKALAIDVENMIIREQDNTQIRYMPSPDWNDRNLSNLLRGGNEVRYELCHDHIGHTVKVRFSTEHSGRVELIFADTMGIVYNNVTRKCQPGIEYSLTIPYGGIQGSGSFVLYIRAGDNSYVEKFHR